MDYEKILLEAKAAAIAAVKAKGPANPFALDCGFAWVKLDGNHPLSRYARKQANGQHSRLYGSKGYPTGWQWWDPGEFPGQAIGHKEAGAKAFRDVLAKYGISADVGSRYD